MSDTLHPPARERLSYEELHDLAVYLVGTIIAYQQVHGSTPRIDATMEKARRAGLTEWFDDWTNERART